MDHIDCIANVFTLYCREVLHRMLDMQGVVDASPTMADAVATVVRRGYFPSIDAVNLNAALVEIPKLRRCLASMDDIKALARRVFLCNFSEEDRYLVFNEEISFSYASKILVCMGLRLRHFSNSPTVEEVVRAELSIAMNTPLISDGAMVQQRLQVKTAVMKTPAVVGAISKRPSVPGVVVVRMKSPAIPDPQLDLCCYESMPTPRQIRQPPRPLPAMSCQR